MNQQLRIQKIEEIIQKDKDKIYGKKEIPWDNTLKPMQIYKVPLEYLIYNKYNGRILSRTESSEKHKGPIKIETKEGKKLIEKFLWESNKNKNKETLNSLEEIGQVEVGIITKDGIIIDGNRRAMLLNEIPKYHYFKTVILDIKYEDDPYAIERFETKYQLGADKKVDYNPIEIYLKLQRLYKQFSKQDRYPTSSDKNQGIKVDKSAIKKIYALIGNYKWIEKESNIEYTLQVMNVMDQYLRSLGYDGIYTALDKREEQFRALTTWLDQFLGKNSGKPFPGYTDDDVRELKSVAFDLIRIPVTNEEFRYLATGHQKNQIFGSKKIWKGFFKDHCSIVNTFNQGTIDTNTPNIEKHVEGIDDSYKNKVEEDLTENLHTYYSKVKNQQFKDTPVKLLTKSMDSFDSINYNNDSFAKPDTQELLKQLNEKVTDKLVQKSPARALQHAIRLLEGIDTDSIPEAEKDEVKQYSKRIQQIGYKINKYL